jgi:hypothetical protein
VAVHQEHVRPHGVATDINVVGERREHPYTTATVQTPGRLEMNRVTQELVNERKRLVVLHDAVALTDDTELFVGVLTDSGVVAR